MLYYISLAEYISNIVCITSPERPNRNKNFNFIIPVEKAVYLNVTAGTLPFSVLTVSNTAQNYSFYGSVVNSIL